jgi:YfiH family protein
MSPSFLCASNLAGLHKIGHGFFSRDGGVSQGLYASLNCGPGSKDDPDLVAENRARIVAALAPEARLFTLSQIHSPIVHMVDETFDPTRRPEGDAMVTATRDLVLGIQTADCAPILLADGRAQVIGAAHAGWKGAFQGVLEATVAAMEKLGATREHIAAAIGPTIAREDYEVGLEFRDKFLAQDSANAAFFMMQGDRVHFDLPGYAAKRLAAAGITDTVELGLSTYPPENGFFSFRRTTHRSEPDYGRQISAIVLVK